MTTVSRRLFRRSFLAGAGVATALAFGGCLSDQVREGDEDTVPISKDVATPGDAPDTGGGADTAGVDGATSDAASQDDGGSVADVGGSSDTGSPADVASAPDGADASSDTAAPADAAADTGGGVAEVTIAGGALKVPVGDTLVLSASVVDSSGNPVSTTITWKAADEATLFVDGTGLVLGISAGATTVTATADGVQSAPVTIQVLAEQPTGASFSKDVIGVFDKSCALSGCHVDGSEAGDLRLDRDPDQLHEKLVGAQAEGKPDMVLISQGSPSQSYLFLKLTRSIPPVGSQMPLGSAPTSAADVQLILRWILNGAPFD